MLRTRLTNILIGMAIAGLLVVMLGLVLPRWFRLWAGPRIASTPVILLRVQSLSQLVTVRYVMEKVILYEDPSIFGDNKVLMIVHANVSAGINLAEIKPGDVEISGKKISIKLPPARAPLMQTEIDETRTKIVERTTGLLRSFDKDMEQNARKQAVLDINLAAQQEGILKEANERAQIQLSNLFTNLLGFDEVEFRK